MAVKLTDLPNEMLTKIIQTIGAISLPYGHRQNVKSLAALCRVSKRLCDLVRPELYRTCDFYNAYELIKYFKSSGIDKVPSGTLLALQVSPSDEDSFACLDEDFAEESGSLAKLTEAVSGVLYFGVYLCCQSGQPDDNHPDYYLPLFKAVNPKSLLYSSGFSPAGMGMLERGKPSLKFSVFVETISSYTRLTKLQMPFLTFDKVTKAQLDILRRLPLEFVRLDWPASLTPAKLGAIVMALPALRAKGLVISYTDAMFEMEFGMGESYAELGFKRSNKGLARASIRAWLKKQGKEELMDKVCWQVATGDEADFERSDLGTAAWKELALVGA